MLFLPIFSFWRDAETGLHNFPFACPTAPPWACHFGIQEISEEDEIFMLARSAGTR